MQTVNHIRTQFLDYFKRQKHSVVASAPLVPHNDPTLMFTNAGMVQFKNVFTGMEKRDYTRASSSQKCVRAGGKHNDLENVGYTARHHTFFEMLGNFSFGDYFKDDAICFGWELLTKDFGLSPEKLLITVYHTDDEAFDIWKKITGFSDDKIIRIPTKDNFWAMGDTGPCGPCSEIFYDHGEDVPGGPPGSKDEDGDRFIEIWNLVFMQYEMLADGKQVDLPAPSIDTGMGLERIAAVLQGVHDNYDIDLFASLINDSKEMSGIDDPKHHNSHRVIADHLRATSFLLADGVMPSNEGRGYVLRRIMRRAMRHVRQIGCKDPLMYRLVPSLIKEMGDAYPELIRGQALITEMLKLEEEKFGETLDRGLKLLDQESAKMNTGSKFSGETAFKLYDTYGFPLDLTKDILRNQDIEVDDNAFDAAMDEQKARAKAAWKGSGAAATDELWFDIHEEFGATEFLGYDTEEAQGKIVALIKDGKRVESAKKGDDVLVVLNQTPFYGESGGQEGDHGVLVADDIKVVITNTSKHLQAVHALHGKVEKGEITPGLVADCLVDGVRRAKLRANHSVTHILHSVLREILGEHVVQKGSLVAEDRLRFDISHPKAVTSDEIFQIEIRVNEIIRQNTSVGTRVMEPDDAIKAGALALFGEKYGEEVRVVNMGLHGDRDFSVELCGGTHVKATGDIGCFKIISESAIAAGVRRIEALTGKAALDYIGETEKNLFKAAEYLKVGPQDVVSRLEEVLSERKKLEKEVTELRKKVAMGSSGGGGSKSSKEDINGIAFIGQHFDDISPKDLRGIVGELQQQLSSGVVAVTSVYEGKSALIVAVSDDLTDRVNAVDLVKSAADTLGAKGAGGKPGFAQTGGPNTDQVDKAMDQLRQALSN